MINRFVSPQPNKSLAANGAIACFSSSFFPSAWMLIARRSLRQTLGCFPCAMCMMVYIAADNPLPLIEWQENVTAFCVSELTEDEKRVSKQFSKPFLAYAGSFGGCSCGFSYGEEAVEDEDDLREDALSRESVRQLSEYLSPLVKNGSIEIFACWDGDQEVGPEERLTVTPDYFGGEAFAFKEEQFLVVERAQMS